MRQDSHPALVRICRPLAAVALKELTACMNSETHTMNPLVRAGRALLAWFDTGRASAFEGAAEQPGADRIDWLRTLPFILMHAACLSRICGWCEPHRTDRVRGAVFHPHVRDHGVLSPLLLAQVVQDLARRPVHLRRARLLGRAARTRSGGPRTIAITTSTRTRRKTCTRPSSTASCAPTWAGSCRRKVSRPISSACAT